MSVSNVKLIVVAGPTSSGKSALATFLARELGGAIVSADSMQIYKGFDIGTAKESKAVREEIPHYLIDVAKPDEEYSVAKYKDAADKAISDIVASGKQPIIAGGTGLYLDALLYEMSFASTVKNPELRARLKFEAETTGGAALYERLARLDPKAAETLHPNDEKRVIRALEIVLTTGKTKDERVDNRQNRYEFLGLMLDPDRAELYKRIDARVLEMFEGGLEKEVKSLVRKYGFDTQSMQAIGYKEFKAYLNGEATKEETIELIQKNTRNYAKRQVTWFKKSGFLTVEGGDPEAALELCESFLFQNLR